VSQAVDEVAIITLGASLGRWASITGSVFIIFAMLTSYWSVSYALATVVEERLKIAPRPSWLIATLPSLALVLVLSKSFLDFMELAGGAIALIVAFMVMPLYNAVRKSARVTNPDFKLTTLGTVAFQALVVIGYIAMAIGSVLPK
jgi:amino acid permease